MGYRVLSATTLAGLLLAGTPAGASDLPGLGQPGVLMVIVAADEQAGRFNPRDAGEPGFERELIERFAKLHRLRVESVVVARYKDRIPALLEGRGDAIIAIHETDERHEIIAFTQEVMPARQVVVTHKPHSVIRTPEQLRSATVGILRGTTTWLRDTVDAGVPDAEIERFPSLDAVFEALRSGKITATVMSVADLGLAMAKDPSLQPGLALGTPGSSCWGVRQEDRELRQSLDEYLTSVRRTPTWSRLVVKYFGDETLLVLGRQ